MSNIIEIKTLKKSYGNNEILHGISFDVKQGEIFGLLGVNGAGKTTTLSCLEGLTKVDSGDLIVNGKLGVQLQVSSLPKNIQCMEAIELFAKWNHVQINMKSLENLGVLEFKKRQYKDCSTGQKRRLHLAIALLGNPDIVILDEPTAGLDVEGRIALHEEIRKLKNLGKTILLASHDMAEVEDLCDRIAILKDGQIAFIGEPSELSRIVQKTLCIKVQFVKEFSTTTILNSKHTEMDHRYYVFETNDVTEAISEICSEAKKQTNKIKDIKIDLPTLEQQFMAIAKERSV